MAERAFYDTVIFALSLNTGDRDHESCRSLLDTDSGQLSWAIVLSAITRGEATLDEYLDQLEQRCALQGIEWVEVPIAHVTEVMKQKRAIKSRLEQAGMQSRDIKQVFAAVCGRARIFVTRDRDFFDPKDKGRRGKKTRGTRVRDVVLDEVGVEPLFPAEALERLRAA